MAKLSRDFSAGNLHPREAIFATGLIAANGAEVVAACDGSSAVMLDLRSGAAFNMSLEVSGTVDGVNWTPIPMRPVNQAAKVYVALLSANLTGLWVGSCAGFRQVRARAAGWVSGSVQASLTVSLAPPEQGMEGLITPLLVTTIGAAGAATTLTLPAPGAGLRQYLTYLAINRFATALLTAGAAPVAVTTTNLPGTLAFSFAADAAAQGTLDRWREDFAFPLASSAQNTATTIVCPATTNVIWRVTAGYYVAP